MGLSRDPDARARQLANLDPANLRSDAARKHGARSEPVVRDLASVLLVELQRTYPGESEVWLALQSRRLAKVRLLGEYLEGRPSMILNQRHGRVNPAAEQEESLSRALLADLEKADARKRGAGANGGGAAGLEALRQRGAAMIGERTAGDE